MQNERNISMAEISNYFANPHNKLMVKIETLNQNGFGEIQCTCNGGSMADAGSHGSSFRTMTPFVRVIDMEDKIKELQAKYDAMPKNQREMVKMAAMQSTGFITYFCQSQGYSGIDGKIYFNGKEVSSDVSNIQYGAITLQYALTPDEILTDK